MKGFDSWVEEMVNIVANCHSCDEMSNALLTEIIDLKQLSN